MSIETAMQALNTPTPEAAAPQQQAISPKEVAAATVEQETNAKNNVKLADSAADSKVPETAASKPAETTRSDGLSESRCSSALASTARCSERGVCGGSG